MLSEISAACDYSPQAKLLGLEQVFLRTPFAGFACRASGEDANWKRTHQSRARRLVASTNSDHIQASPPTTKFFSCSVPVTKIYVSRGDVVARR